MYLNRCPWPNSIADLVSRIPIYLTTFSLARMNFFRVIACNNRGSLKYYICGIPNFSDSMPLKKTLSILENTVSKAGSFNFLQAVHPGLHSSQVMVWHLLTGLPYLSVCQLWLSQDIHHLIIYFPLLPLHFINVLNLLLRL